MSSTLDPFKFLFKVLKQILDHDITAEIADLPCTFLNVARFHIYLHKIYWEWR